nr:unnamed protein product [Spirometra erinaceieuropaei]
MTGAPDSGGDSTSAVTLSVPYLWTSAPELYFLHIESSFCSANSTKEVTKFHRLTQALLLQALSQVQSLIQSTPVDQPYTQLKAEPHRLLAVSDRQRYHQLIREKCLGDRKHTELLRRMQGLRDETMKPGSQRIDATVFFGSSGSGRTFYVCDSVTLRRFLVDTGAQISVILPTPVDRRFSSSSLHLQATNCSPILTFDSLSPTSNTSLHRSFFWIFVIAAVLHSILGSNFLAEFDLLVDCRRSRLLDRSLVFTRHRRLTPARLQAAKADFGPMLQLGIIRPSESPGASPGHMLTKTTSGHWRRCGDNRTLSNATIFVLHLQDFVRALFDKTVFPKIDLVGALHQILVAHEDIPKTAVTTLFGLFEFIHMPLGLRDAAQMSQRFIAHVLRDIPLVCAYIDNLLVASQNVEEHKEHLAFVLDRTDKCDAIINPSSVSCSDSSAWLTFTAGSYAHVFVRCDRVCQLLESPYEGQFRVLAPSTKVCRILRWDKEDVVSANRVKAVVAEEPTHLPQGQGGADPLTPVPPPPLSPVSPPSLLPSPSPPLRSIPPSLIFPLPTCLPHPTATLSSSIVARTQPSSAVASAYITHSGRHIQFLDRLVTHFF